MEGSFDSNVVGSSRREEKPSKRVKEEGSAERTINMLPEPLITHILSFLPTKDAVGTCALSKAWAYRWTTMTKLNFDDSVHFSPKRKTGKQHFITFVNRALLLNKSPSIEVFSLVITHKYHASLFNTWISSILNRNVKNIYICSHFEIPLNAYTSSSLFDSMVLEELVMKMICPIRLSTTFIHFGNLKSLRLSSVVFDIDSRREKDLTLSFPVLKVFETINCTWFNASSVTVRMPQVEHVLIEHDPEIVFYDLDSIPINISTSRLTEFTIRSYCYVAQNVILLDPSSARNASADITLGRCENDSVSEAASYASSLLRQCCEVKSLKFDGSEILLLSKSNLAILPLFGMLSHLELGFVTAEFLLTLLLKSPVLKTLTLKVIFKFEEDLFNNVTVVPHCLTSTLQLVKFGEVYGLEHELFLAKFFMENCKVMERMSFSLANRSLAKSEIIEEFKQKIISFKRGFACAIVEFSSD